MFTRPCGSHWTDYNASKMVIQIWAESSGTELGAPESPAWFWGCRVCRKEMVSRYLSSVVHLAAHCAQPHPLEWDVMALILFIIQSSLYGVSHLFKENVFIKGYIPMGCVFCAFILSSILKGFYCRPMQFLFSLCFLF